MSAMDEADVGLEQQVTQILPASAAASPGGGTAGPEPAPPESPPHRNDPPSRRGSQPGPEVAAILEAVKKATGHDFNAYKTNTVTRRITRRLSINNLESFAQYASLLRENRGEAHALCQDIMIGVTSFFRDPEAFSLLKNQVIPKLFADRRPDEPVRIWHACCATGEEVYSTAMLIREYLEEMRLDAKVLIFATDIDETAIAQARSGIYERQVAEQAGEQRLARFFTGQDGRCQVVKALREMVVFAQHSLVKDPPFSRLDLLVCRNFLIYLNPDMQRRLTATFHQVLRPHGFLFLGAAETVERSPELFAAVDKKWKLFQRQAGERRQEEGFPLPAKVPVRPSLVRFAKPAASQEADPGVLAEKLLVERFAPPSVMVNEKYEVVHVSVSARGLLEVPSGKATRDILRMARVELRPALRAAIYKAFSEQRRVEFKGVSFVEEGRAVAVNVVVEPVEAPQSAGRLALVVFQPAALPPAPVASVPAEESDGGNVQLVRHLEEQLRVTHEQLQATTEQLDSCHEGFLSANEELMSINEEFQSANEELQSTNEELETSKEELQALNEELSTLNSELQGTVEELNQANTDMENLLTSSATVTIFLDRGLNIKGFTPAFAALFNLIRSDLGRPFRHLAGKIDWPSFQQDAGSVLAGEPFAEREVSTLDGQRCYLKRLAPYRTQDGRIDGVVVTFIDITDRKEMEEALRESEQRVRLKLSSILSPEGELGSLELGDILDAPGLQSLMDDFYQLTRLPMGLLDIKGKILVGTGWQPACTMFHRANPDSNRNCLESDTVLSAGVPPGEYRVYKCKNNMWDVATPVMIGDRVFGNLFMGQFFFEDEPVDYQLFRAQARRYGFEEDRYLSAIASVPRLTRETLKTSMSFFMKLADGISRLSFSNLKLARSLGERDLLMQSLEESDKRLQLFIEHAPAALAMFDNEMRYLTVSRRWLNVYGLEGRELIGRCHYEVFPEIGDSWRRAHRRGLAGEVLRSDGDRFERQDGSVQWIRWEIRPWHDLAGRIGGILIFSDDITELKKAEEIQRRYELLAQNSRDIILFVRRDDGRIIEANAAAVKSYRYGYLELLSLTIAQLREPGGSEEVAAQLEEADLAESSFETTHYRKDGSSFPVEVSSQGATIGDTRILISVIRDVTRRKGREAELRQAKEAAEAATRTKSQFLANMSHELRTPMTGVLGMLDLALSGELEQEQRECIAAAYNSARSLVRILNDILDLTRMEMDKVSIEVKPFSIRKCLEHTVHLLLPAARNKGLELILQVAKGVPDHLLGDQTRLSQVVTNLASNAVKFCDKGEVAIRVQAAETCGGSWEVTLSVSDTGIGIPHDKKHLLFKVFSQVDESHSRCYGGTGLGLVISKGIVERMGGTISFTSEDGKGSTFTCTIPFRRAQPAVEGERAAGDSRAVGAVSPVEGMLTPRLLVAEDDHTIRDVLGRMLRRGGYQVDFAVSGKSAVEMWELGSYDLILMDVQMPAMNGFDATSAIRRQERVRGGHVPIIAMTAHAFKESEERCLAVGMDGYVSKPIDFKQTLQTIAEVIRNPPGSGA
ncbi:MAG TPA: CheR family methyltransferase [Geomonas sp.]|nr:CheR family methyltransferase [Geomonas sp.]